MQGTRVRWLLTLAIVGGIMLTTAAWGAAGQEQTRSSSVQAAQVMPTVNKFGDESIHLFLTANGTRIEGDSIAPTKARDNSIQVVAMEHAVITAREAGSGMATGRRQYQPLKITKRVDKSSPLLLKALTTNERIDGSIQFFRPNPTGDGTTEQYYTIAISGGRIVDYNLVSNGSEAPLEEVSITFEKISWTYTNGGVTHEDTWDAQR